MASIARPMLLRQAAAASRLSAVPAGPSLLLKNSARVAAFHATSRRNILPPLPQKVEGGINDPVPVPPPSPTHGSYHWTFERLVGASLVPLTLTPFAAGSLNPGMDAVLMGLIVIHSHLGFQNIIIDYLPKRRTPKSRKAAMWGLNLATALVALGLYEFETTDVGVTEAIKRIWHA
ncbi:hypothetical protein BR93DRAFT_723023 [Coniochaeta sp. PMI_546]|nr:hypothetical protein BR93DRAFT_723023 [Coniochaeta sp. PMI_546]